MVFLRCRADPSVIHARLEGRRNDASDADWFIYLKAAAHWEEPDLATNRSTWDIDSGEPGDQATLKALLVLRDLGLAD